MARPKGSTNRRTQGVLALLRKEFDLDPILELAQTIRKEVPLRTKDGELVPGVDGKPVMVPFLSPSEMIQALGKLADKTYPNLKAVEVSAGEGLPSVVINLRGVEEETPEPKRKPAPKRKAAPRRARKESDS